MSGGFKGKCFCGDVKYNVTEEAIAFVVCHCTDCQALSGGGPAHIQVVTKDSLKIDDPSKRIADFSSKADSGNLVTRHFCSRCGTPMFETLEADPSIRLVKSGTMDDASQLKVDATVYTSSAQPWALIDRSSQLFEENIAFPIQKSA
jgi:hypothetical protein